MQAINDLPKFKPSLRDEEGQMQRLFTFHSKRFNLRQLQMKNVIWQMENDPLSSIRYLLSSILYPLSSIFELGKFGLFLEASCETRSVGFTHLKVRFQPLQCILEGEVN